MAGEPTNPRKPMGSFTAVTANAIPQADQGPGADDGYRVLKLDPQVATSASGGGVDQFAMPDLRKQGPKLGYAAVKSKYGPIAATDEERAHRSAKDKRFSLNPMLKSTLSVEAEESRVIDERVRAKIASVEAEARAAAEKRGYEGGYEAGKNEAEQFFNSEAEKRLESLVEFVKAIEGAKESIFKANERYLMELVFRVTRMMLLRELTTDKDYLLRLTRSLVEKSGARDSIRVRVSVEDMDKIKQLREGLVAAFGEMRNLDIRAAAEIKQGGCIVDTEWNSVDASVDTQLEAIRRAMTGDAQ